MHCGRFPTGRLAPALTPLVPVQLVLATLALTAQAPAQAQQLGAYSTAQFMVDYGRPLSNEECIKLSDIGFRKVGFVRRSREDGYSTVGLTYTRNNQQIASALCRSKSAFIMLSVTDPFRKNSARTLVDKVYDALPESLP